MILIKSSLTYQGNTNARGKIGTIDFRYRFKYFNLWASMTECGSLNYDFTPAIIREARIRQGKTIPTPAKLNVLTYPEVFKKFSDGFIKIHMNYAPVGKYYY